MTQTKYTLVICTALGESPSSESLYEDGPHGLPVAMVPFPEDPAQFILRKKTRDQITTLSENEHPFSSSAVWALDGKVLGPHSNRIPDEVVNTFHLVEGDKLTIQEKDGMVEVTHINDQPASMRRDKPLPNIREFIPDPPSAPLPFESVSDAPSIRMSTVAGASYGVGTTGYAAGTGKAGKSEYVVNLIEAGGKLQKMFPQKIAIIGTLIGDRPLDYGRYIRALNTCPGHTEFYTSPWTDVLVNQIQMLEFVAQRVAILCIQGYHVLWFVDGASRAVGADSASGRLPKEALALRGGYFRESIQYVTGRILGICGDYTKYGWGSITGCFTALAGEPTKAENVVYDESGDNVSTLTVMFNKTIAHHPKIEFTRDGVDARFPPHFDFRGPLQVEEQETMRDKMYGTGEADTTSQTQVRWELERHFAENPRPTYAKEALDAFTRFMMKPVTKK